MIRSVRPIGERINQGAQRFGCLLGLQHEGRHHVHLYLRNNAQRTQGNPPQVVQLAVQFIGCIGVSIVNGAVRGDDAETPEHPGKPGVVDARAVGSGADRAHDGLRIHVTLIRQRHTQGPQQFREIAQPSARVQGHGHIVPVEMHQTTQVIQVHQHARGLRERHERVPRAHCLDPTAGCRGLLNEFHQFGFAARLRDLLRVGAD